MLTIATPNTDRSLLTLAERKAALGITDSSMDAQLTALGSYVDATITRACQVQVARDTPPTLRLEPVTETFQLKYTVEVVYLTRRPIAEVASVSEAGVVLAEDVDYEIDGQGIYRLVNGSRAFCGNGWAVSPALIVVDYSGGWDVVPDDLKYAAIKFTQAAWHGGGQPRDPLLKRVHIEGVSLRDYSAKDTAIPADVLDMLEFGGYVHKWEWIK
ncbi:MAG: hypothetical protein E6J90_08840 [Deltaproteobacteria bacterium]|nr:MAG: hypothetical protein E6J90_08840 [Deltaproteobacteria bacterium]